MSVAAVLTCLWSSQTGAQEPAAPPDVPMVQETVVVVGVTPVDGIGVDRDLVPANLQMLTSEQLSRSGGFSAVEQLSLSAASVHLNDTSTNPLQPDLQYRGFTVSPLLGLPQGLAVYQNGVRLNEPFGDTVNWDLLPAQAIAGINLVPGSNPLFGLNALGGAITLRTKNGFSHAGQSLAVSGGSFGRYLVEGASGGQRDRLSYFVAGSAMTEEGWRDFSSSRMAQLFGDVGYRSATTTVHATVTSGFNRLIGNGPLPIELLEEDRTAVFTHPDETRTRMTMLTLQGRQHRSPTTVFEASLYFRRAAIGTLNGDDSPYDECEAEALAELLCADEGEGEIVRDQSGRLVEIDDGDELNGTNHTSETLSHGWGGALQATLLGPMAGRDNHFVAGLTFDGGRSGYESDAEIARLTDDRGTEGVGLFDTDAAVRLRTSVRHTGMYAANFHTLARGLTLVTSARLNYSTVRLRDQLGDELNGDHAFTSLNPSVGLTYAVAGGPTLFGSYSVSSRVPSPSELSCADEDDPCRLPNAFVSDPPLEQVVARTVEGGVRGRQAGLTWTASVFRTANQDDIMFISSGPLTNTGHFENVGDTRRRGLELAAGGTTGGVQWNAAYSWLRAEFASPLTVSSPNHPFAEAGEIVVAAGRRIPGVPQHNLKLGAAGRVGRLALAGVATTASRQYLRGDEANLLPAVDGFTLVNLSASYALRPGLRLTVRVSNLLGSAYETFGVLGEPDEVLGDDYEDPRFLSPGAPRAAWFGLEWSPR